MRSAWLERSRDLAERTAGVENVLHHVLRDMKIDAVVREAQPLEIFGSNPSTQLTRLCAREILRWNVARTLIGKTDTGAAVTGRRFVNDEFSPDRKSTRLNSSHIPLSRMPSSA